MKKKMLALALAAILFGCVRDIDDLTFTKLRPGVLVPIGRFTIGADNLTKIGDSIPVRVGESNVLEFYYETEVLKTLLNDRFTIKDQTFSDQIPFNSFVFIAGQTNEVKASEYNSFTISNSDLPSPAPSLEKIIFKGGFINTNQSKDFDHRVETTISFPKLIKNGVPFAITLTNNASENTPLDGYELDLTGTSGLESNTLEYELSTIIENTGASLTGTISFAFQLASMEFSYLGGDFQSYNFDDIEGDFELGLPEIEIPDNIGFTNPQVVLLMQNSSGIDMELGITELSVTKYNDEKLFVTGTFDDQPILIKGAVTPGENKISNFSMSNENTDNLPELISSIPKSAFMRGSTEANPNGPPTNGNFVTDSSQLVVNAELVLPLEGFANNYAFVDTVKDISLQMAVDSLVSFDNVNVHLLVENNFPFEIGLQLYFLDSTEQQNVIDSLFTTLNGKKIFESANVDDSGLAISPTVTTNDIGMDNELYEKIRYAKSIKIGVYLSTAGADATPRKSVRISADNYITIGLGLSLNAIIDLNHFKNN